MAAKPPLSKIRGASLSSVYARRQMPPPARPAATRASGPARHLLNRVPPPPLPPRICPSTGKAPEAELAAYCKDCSFTASAGSTLLVSTSVKGIVFQAAPSASKIMVSNQVIFL